MRLPRLKRTRLERVCTYTRGMADFRPSLERRVQDFLGRKEYRPLKQHELARELKLKGGARSELRQVLRALEQTGKIMRLRKNRWALPEQGKQVRGTLHVHVRGFGFVRPDDKSLPEVYLPDDALGTALHGDRVLISMVTLPRRKHRARPDLPPTDRAEGRIERVIERGTSQLVGLVRTTPYYTYVIPDNPRFLHDVRLVDDDKTLRRLENHKVLVRLEEWTSLSRPLTGILLEDLGPVDQPGVDMLALLRGRQLDPDFTDAVKDEARRFAPGLPAEALDGRRDLRSLLTLTIDPVDAKDYDDAVSLEITPGGDYLLGVHIADVAHYVEPGSAMDLEARTRGTSVYLVDRVITMLPPYLTTEVCSLQPNTDRVTHSVMMNFSKEGVFMGAETCRSTIHSKARLNYQEVQAFLDGGEVDGVTTEVRECLSVMRKLARLLRRHRVAAGSVDLVMPEVKCLLDAEGHVVEVQRRGATEAYQLIEEFMLAANQAVARRFDGQDAPGLYRVHEPPEEEQWAEMAAVLDGLGVSLRSFDRDAINAVSRAVEDTPISYAAQLAILRHFKRAMYAAELGEHFGLAFSHYTHFTSPIRRYPDLVAHRLLRALEDGDAPPYSQEEISRIAEHCSQREREADEAESESVEIKRVDFYAKKLWAGEIGPYHGVITGMVPRGLLVELSDSLQRGLVPFTSFPGEYYRISSDRTRAMSRRRKSVWRLGDEVQVELTRVDTARRLIDFRMVSQPGKRRKSPA